MSGVAMQVLKQTVLNAPRRILFVSKIFGYVGKSLAPGKL